VSVGHGHFISSNGKQALRDGTYAFVSDLASKKLGAKAGRMAAAGSEKKSSGVPYVAAGWRRRRL